MSNRTIDFNSNSLVLNNFRFKKQDKVLSTGGIVAIILSILVILIILTIFYLYLKHKSFAKIKYNEESSSYVINNISSKKNLNK